MMSNTVPSAGTSVVDEEPGALRLNLGCGYDHRAGPGWVNVDVRERFDPDVLADLNDPWPWADGHATEILARHVLEHLEDLEHAIDEAARVLEPGGRLEVVVPVGANAHTDPTHANTWTYDTPLFFADNADELSGNYYQYREWGLELVDRELDVELLGPASLFNPLVRRLVDRQGGGVWATSLPCMAGELTAVYVKQ